MGVSLKKLGRRLREAQREEEEVFETDLLDRKSRCGKEMQMQRQMQLGERRPTPSSEMTQDGEDVEARADR